MAYETILYDVNNNILTITLNRPDKLNAFNTKMMREMIDAFDQADADDQVKAIIVTGSGRAFCAGADLSRGGETFDHEAAGTGMQRDGGGLLTLRIFECMKPCLLYTSPSPRDRTRSRMPSSA